MSVQAMQSAFQSWLDEVTDEIIEADTFHEKTLIYISLMEELTGPLNINYLSAIDLIRNSLLNNGETSEDAYIMLKMIRNYEIDHPDLVNKLSKQADEDRWLEHGPPKLPIRTINSPDTSGDDEYPSPPVKQVKRTRKPISTREARSNLYSQRDKARQASRVGVVSPYDQDGNVIDLDKHWMDAFNTNDFLIYIHFIYIEWMYVLDISDGTCNKICLNVD